MPKRPLKIAPEVADVLRRSSTTGNQLVLPGGLLDRKLYDKVNAVIETLGGRWSAKARCHVFAHCRAVDAINHVLSVGEIRFDENTSLPIIPTKAAVREQRHAFAQYVSQEMVDTIVRRARDSDLGLGAGLTHKQGHLQISQHELPNLKALALLLVDGFDEKYDLASVFGAALETVAERVSIILHIEEADRERYMKEASAMSILWEPLGPVGNGRLHAHRFTASPQELFEFGQRTASKSAPAS